MGTIGDLKYSILPPAIFRQENGGGWVLLDGGQDLQNAYETTWENTRLFSLADLPELPDARGFFLRAYNAGRTEGGDPEQDRRLGTPQNDDLKEHYHVLERYTPYGGAWGHAQGNQTSFDKRNTTAVGGAETRPKNVAFYLYLKVND